MKNQNQMRDVGVLVLGLLLVIGCIALARFDPQTYNTAAFQMRVLTALGGGLIGTTVPGLIGLDVKGVRAVGATGFVVLFYLMAPSALGGEGGSEQVEAGGRAGEKSTQPGGTGAPVTTPMPVPAPGPGPQPTVTITNSPMMNGSGQQTVNYDQHTENK